LSFSTPFFSTFFRIHTKTLLAATMAANAPSQHSPIRCRFVYRKNKGFFSRKSFSGRTIYIIWEFGAAER